MRARTGAALASFLLAPVLAAAAPPCPAGARPWVWVAVQESDPGALPERTIEHLRAELESSGIDVCVAPRADAPPPLATVRFRASDQPAVRISTQVEDAVTSKELSRELDLRSTPPNARAATVALGAAELLRASWAELDLASVPAGSVPAPPEVETAVAQGRRRARAREPGGLVTVGLAIAGEEFSGGLRQLGLDARVVWLLDPRLHLGVRLGARGADGESGPDGDVKTDAWIAGLFASTSISTLSDRAGVEALVRADALRLRFVGTPAAGATGSRRVGTALTLGAGFASWVRLAETLRLEVEAIGGTTTRGVAVTDGETYVVRSDGLFVAGAAGFSLRY